MPSGDVVEFGGWPRPPRWVWAIAGVVVVAMVAGVVVARAGPHHATASSPPGPPATAASPVGGSRTAAGSAARWPSAAGACGSPVDLPQIHLARQHPHVHGRVLVGGVGLRQVTLGGAVSGPLPGPPERGWLVTNVVSGPGAGYAFDTPCFSSTASVRVYRIVAGAAHRLRIAAGAVLGRLGEGSPIGAADHVLLMGPRGCAGPPAHGTCTLESIDLNTGRAASTVKLPAGRVPVWGDLASPVLSPDGTLAAFQLARARHDPRFAATGPGPPSDVAVLHLRTGRLDIVPGLELPPWTWAGLAFDATGSWLLATVSEGHRGELLAWRPGMPGPALVTSLPGPLVEAPPLLPAPSWWRTG